MATSENRTTLTLIFGQDGTLSKAVLGRKVVISDIDNPNKKATEYQERDIPVGLLTETQKQKIEMAVQMLESKLE